MNTKNQIKTVKESINGKVNNFQQILNTQNEDFESAKHLFNKNNEIEQKYMFGQRKLLMDSRIEIEEKRKHLQTAMQLNYDSFSKINKIKSDYNRGVLDLKEAIITFNQFSSNCGDKKLIEDVALLLSKLKEDSINEMILKKQFKDKASIENVINEISSYKIKISNTVLLRLSDLIKSFTDKK